MARRRHLLVVLATFAVLALVAAAGAEPVQKNDLRVSFDSGFAPRALPRERAVPVSLTLRAKVATTDGSQPPALRRLRLALNRHGRISARGLPTCAAGELQSVPAAATRRRCAGALVGQGRFSAVVPEGAGGRIAIVGSVLAFNAAHKGRPRILLHLFSRAPVPEALVVPVSVARSPRAELGTVLSAQVPKIAGGAGSLTSLKLRIGRTFRRAGRRVGYLSASCAAPAGFREVLFPLARAGFSFAGHRKLQVTITRSCRVR